MRRVRERYRHDSKIMSSWCRCLRSASPTAVARWSRCPSSCLGYLAKSQADDRPVAVTDLTNSQFGRPRPREAPSTRGARPATTLLRPVVAVAIRVPRPAHRAGCRVQGPRWSPAVHDAPIDLLKRSSALQVSVRQESVEDVERVSRGSCCEHVELWGITWLVTGQEQRRGLSSGEASDTRR